MRKFLLNLLFMALMVPWVTQTQAQQCDGGAFMCPVTVHAEDMYSDGWNGASLELYQGTELRGTVNLTSGATAVVPIMVCPDSIRLEWSASNYDEECSFVIISGTGDTLYSADFGDMENVSGAFATVFNTCPSCINPRDFVTTGSTSSSITLCWTNPSNSEWEIVYGNSGIDPEDVYSNIADGEILTGITEDSITITDLESGVLFDFYLRGVCGDAEYTEWIPLLGVGAGMYNMASTGTDTITGCGIIIQDAGGSSNDYAASSNSTLVVYPDENSTIVVSGTYDTESNYDFLKIYDGAGTTGPILVSVSGQGEFGPFFSDNGPITIKFTSDFGGQRAGFQIVTSCVEAPPCSRPIDFKITSLSNNSATVVWTDTTQTYNFEVEYGPAGFELGNGEIITLVDTVQEITDLTPNTEYDVYVRTVCVNGGFSTNRTLSFRTACDPILTESLPFIENFDDWTSLDSCWKFSNNNSSGYPMLSNNSISGSGQSIEMYHSNSNSWNMVVLPLFELPANALQIGFYLYKDNDYNSHEIEVGVVSNPTDASTFVPVAQMSPSTEETWQHYNIFLNSYEGEGRFIAFRTPTTSQWADVFIDSITVSELPNCTAPENIRVSAVGPFSAMVTWEPNVVGEMQSYSLEISEAGADTWTAYTTTDTYMAVTGLTLGTAYEIRVRTDCTDESSSYSEIKAFNTSSCTGAGVIDTTVAADSTYVGDTVAGNSSYLPTYSFYSYSYTQQLFRASELGGMGTITGIDLTSEGTAVQRNLQIFLATTMDTALTSFISDADFTLVWEGSYAATPGVNHFEFSTPFSYGQSGNLLLVVKDNTGSYASGIKHATHTTTGRTMACYTYNDNDPYNTVPTEGTSSTSRNDIVFYSYPCDDDPDACIAPVLALIDASVTEATVAWTAGNNETSYTVEYQIQGDTVWTEAESLTSETNLTINGLTPNTYYRIRVTNDCGSSSIVTAYTACGKIDAYPWYENFDATTVFPSCWYKNSTSDPYYPYVDSWISVDPNGNSLYFDFWDSGMDGSIYTMIATPQVDTTVFPMDTLQVTFAIYNSNSDESAGIMVGVMSDPNDYSTLVPVDTVFTSAVEEWEYFEIPLSSYNGNGSYIALITEGFGEISSSYFYLDELEINIIPTCTRPRDIAVDTNTLSSTDATITWTSTGAGNYEIQYGIHGFQLGAGLVVYSTTNSVALTGLTPSSMYDVYVRGLCEGSDTSAYSFVYSFFTDCATLDNLPFTENFNNWANSMNVPHCWTPYNGYSDYYPNMSTSYDYSNVTGGRSLYLYNSVTAGSATDIVGRTAVALPELASSIPANTTQVLFQLITGTNSTSYEYGVIVGVAVDPSDPTTFTPIDTIIATYNQWTIHEVPFDSYTGTGKYIMFRDYANILSGTYAYPSVYIDDVVLETIPTCRRPRDLVANNATPTSVDLSWTDISTPTSWVVEYGPVGFELGTGTKVLANSNPFTLTGLSSSTFYEYNVRQVCSGTDSSDYSLINGRFATLQIPASIPYAYDFETNDEWANWQVNCNDTIVNWYRGNAVANGGTQSMYISADTAATNSTLFRRINATAYRDIDFGTIDSSFVLTFDARIGGNTEAVYDALAIVLADPNDYVEADNNNSFGTPWGQINDPNLHVYDYFRLTNDEWQTFSVPFDTISGVHRVAFFWFNQSTQTSWQGEPAAVDNIAIDYSTCPRPLNLHATPGLTTAALSWEGTADGYVVYYRAVDSTDIHSVYTPSNTCTISGLTSSGVEYVWAVRALCGSDTSMYSDSHVFRTTCFDGAVTEFPYIEDFEMNISCWNQIIVSGTTEWVLGNGSNYTSDNAYSGDNNAKFYYGGSGQSAWLISPVLNLNAISEPYLKFAHLQRDWAGDQDTLGVYYRVHQDSAWVYLASYNTSIVEWQLDSIGLPVSSATFQIGFFGFNDYGYGIAIDSVVVNGEGVRCPQPILTATVVNNTATISWSEAGNYELQYREASATEFGDVITVTNASSYLLADLLPMTDYVCQVRRDCGEEDGYSIWSEVTFTTEDLPCIAPTDFTATNITYTSATVSWTDPSGNQIAWFVEYGYGANFDTITVTSPTVNLSNLYDGTTYTVKVQGQCSATIYSDWSEAFTFSTTTCEGVSNLATGTVTANSAVINWTAGANQTKWEISYGMEGFTEGNGTNEIVEGTPSFTITGLESDMKYDVYVRNICQEGVTSAWSNKIQFRTTVGINTASTDNVRVQIYPNPANSEATVSVDGINGKVEFVVADMNGRMIVTETINCEGSLVKTIDVSNLAKGAYFVHIYNDDFNTTRKLIVK